MYKNWYLLFIVFVWAVAPPKILYSQSYKELTIENGEVYELKKSLTKFDKITVRGILKVTDERRIKIETALMVIDGGTLAIGTNENPHRNEFILSLKKVNQSDSGIKVMHGGNLFINGVSRGNDSLDKTIHIGSTKNIVGANIQIENAGTVQMHNVSFENLGSAEKPVVNWKGTTKKGFIKNCVFANNQGESIVLEDTNIALEKNHIESENASAITCRSVRSKMGNHIFKNTIYTKSSDSLYSIAVYDPYHKIDGNTLVLSGNASGIQILPDENNKILTSEIVSKNFSLNGNVIQGSNRDTGNFSSVETVGLLLGDFGQGPILKATNNKVSKVSIGAIVRGPNYIIDKLYSKNNHIGIYPGKGYVSNSSFKMDAKTKYSQAIVASGRFGAVAPKISSITIENYDTGIHFEGVIEPSNYLEKITFKNTHPVSFGFLSKDSHVLDRDGSLTSQKKPENLEVTEPHNHHEHHQMAHEGHKPRKNHLKKRTLIYPKNSMLVSKHSELVLGSEAILQSKEQLSGILTISTGFGLSDPVHEHHRSFKSLQIENKETGNLQKVTRNCINKDFFLAANASYDINYDAEEGTLYDIGFEWEAAPDTWILITLPYKHKNPVALRSFGALIPPSKSLDELDHASHTTYFIDEEKKIATLKLYNKQHLEEFVVYSRSILTEISFEHQKVPIELSTNWDKKQILISFEAPENKESKLEVLDYYGNVVTTLFNGITTNKLIESSLDIAQFDVQNKIFRYSLTVDGKNHKGPIYAY